MDANEDYLDSLLNSVMSQESGGGDGGWDNAQQNNGSKAELEEINDLLKKSDQNQVPDAEMLAMLEREESEKAEGSSDNDVPDVFDIFSSESMESEEHYDESHAAGQPVTGGMQSGADKEAYLDALLNGTASGDQSDGSGQTEEGSVSLDSLQSREDLSSLGAVTGEEDLLSLDSLQTGEEPMPAESLSGSEDLLSLDSLQTVEEPLPTDGLSEEKDFLSLDNLQTEEEPMPTDSLSGGEDFFSLDNLQTEEEPIPAENQFGGEDLLSLDNLQTGEEPMSAESLSGEEDLFSLDNLQAEEDMEYESSSEEDDEIQREIDELLGVAGVRDEEESEQSGNNGSGVTPAETADDVEDAGNREEKKQKKDKKKKKLFSKKKAADSAQAGAEGSASAEMGDDGQTDGAGSVSADDELMADSLTESAQGNEASEASDGKKKKARRKKQKAEKQKNTADLENGQKEPGFFARLINGLLEEADEEEEQSQELEVSDENREIMAMMENEKIENKKPGSKKAKKGKKGKADAKQETDADDDEEAPVDEKKAKKEKKKKEKKEKKEQKAKAKQEKEQEEKAVPTKKLPKGKVFSVFAFCLTLLAVIVLLSFLIPQQYDLKTAREAYYNQDYLTVYQNMDGKDLSESDYILYMRSRMILNMQGKLDNYLVYMGMDKEMAALNELMLAVHYYQSNRSLAESYGALEEVNTVYEQVLSVLAQQYGLSEAEAMEIFALDDLSYNERLYYLVYGTEFVAPGIPQSGSASGVGTNGLGNETLDDVLPEESEMTGDDQPQVILDNLPANGSDTGIMEPSTDWPEYNETEGWPDGGGTDGFGINMPDSQPSDAYGDDQSWGMDGVMPSDGNGEDSSLNAGGENQPQNTPGESLSQGNGDVLYSGEVQNGNAVLQ